MTKHGESHRATSLSVCLRRQPAWCFAIESFSWGLLAFLLLALVKRASERVTTMGAGKDGAGTHRFHSLLYFSRISSTPRACAPRWAFCHTACKQLRVTCNPGGVGDELGRREWGRERW